MKKYITLFIIAGILAIIVIKLVKNKNEATNRVYLYDKESPIPVFSEIVSGKNQIQQKSYSGVFESMNEVKVSADIQGKIAQIFVNEGQKVTTGQVLLKIDDAMLQLQLNVLETKLSGLKKDETRYSNLSKDDVVPGITLEKTKNAIETIEAEKKTILEQINKSVVKAPFNGIITLKFCEIGGFASPAVPLFEIINQTELKFVVNVPEEDLHLFTNNQEYYIQANNLNEKPLLAKLLQVSSKGGIGNSFKIEFSFDKTTNIKSKMIGNVTFTSKGDKINELIIPSSAVLGSESNPEIYLVKNGKATRTQISITSRNSNSLSVNGEIAIGDTIITGGFINLFDNANVTVNK